MLNPSGLYYPNRFARYFLQGMQDALSEDGFAAIRDIAGLTTYLSNWPPDTMDRQFDFAYIAALSEGLEELYGARGGRGVALRIGRAWYEQGFKTVGALAGFQHPVFQGLSLERRAHVGLQALTNVFNQHSDQQTTLQEEGSTYIVTVEISPMAWGRQEERPVCHALTGLIQGCLHSASNGYEFHVREHMCRATGHDECVFAINKKPIGQL